MKKLLLSLSFIAAIISTAIAETITFDWATIGGSSWSNGYTNTGSYENEDVTISITGCSKQTSTIKDRPVSKNAGFVTITLKDPASKSFSLVKFTGKQWGTKAQTMVLKYSTDGETFNAFPKAISSTNFVVEATSFPDDTKAIQLSFTNASNQIGIDNVEYTLISNNSIEPVIISSELIGVTPKVTLSCATEGATIYYGTSADEITTEYTAPFDVTENCTIFAFAQVGDEKGKITSQTIVVPYTSFRDVVTKASADENIIIIGNFEVIFKNGQNVILTDGISNLLVEDVTDGIVVGTKISMIEGNVGIIQGLFDICEATLTVGGEGASYSAKPVDTLADLTPENNYLDQIIIDGCTVSGASNSKFVNIGSDSKPLNNRYNLDITNGVSYKMWAFVWVSGESISIVPYKLEAGTVKETVKTPVITPNTHEIKVDATVTITCATEGAKIYYTLDGTVPTQNSTLYNEPFTIPGDATVSARAFYEGNDKEMLPSEIVTKEYHLFNPRINIIDNHHEEGGGSYSAHKCIVDDVEYSMYGMHSSQYDCIQMNQSPDSKNNARFCYIAQTGDNENLALDKITFKFNQNSKNISFTVRASNEPYNINTENSVEEIREYLTTTGDEIGTINNDQVTVKFDRDYDYFVLYPDPKSSNAIYITSITVEYRDPRPADEAQIPAFDDDFEAAISSDEEGLLIGQIPYHLDWYPKYKINDGEEDYLENYETPDCQIISGNFDAATLHNIKIWYEHHYTGATSTVHEFNHLTKPSFTADATKESMSFGNLGEGVKVYFTINGQDPEIPASTPANAPRRAKTSETDNTYVIDSEDDATATHVISKSNTTVTVHHSVTPAVNINAVAVHEATGTVSDAIKESGVTTSIVAIEAEGAAKAAYDLMGRKVEKPANGLYIIGGKKVRL